MGRSFTWWWYLLNSPGDTPTSKGFIFYMRLIVAGTRTFRDYILLRDKLDLFLSHSKDRITIFSGNAPGADALGEQYAKQNNYNLKIFKANWKTLGKRAGFVRNEEMAKEATHCVVFWDGKSKGSEHMINLAKQYQLHLRIIRYK